MNSYSEIGPRCYIPKIDDRKYEVKDLNAPSRWNMRIWDDDKKEWLCQSDEECLIYYGFDITGGETTEFQGLPKWHPDRHLIWEQSTGLKDKSGKEIYEGDIMRYDAIDYQVLWSDYYAGFETKRINSEFLGEGLTLHFLARVGRVIGNIHENGDLLEEEK